MQVGKLYRDQIEVPPGGRKVNGGWETKFHFPPTEDKWLVCVYGGNEWRPGTQMIGGAVEWWGKVDPKTTSCVLKVNATKEQYMPTFWTATASCK